jgi:hypothetical protein
MAQKYINSTGHWSVLYNTQTSYKQRFSYIYYYTDDFSRFTDFIKAHTYSGFSIVERTTTFVS